MPTLTLTLDTFSLKSSWRAWLEMGETQFTTPSTGSVDKTFDLSAILSGSTVTAATLSGATNGQGDSHARFNSITKNITNAFNLSVLNWFSGMTTFGSMAVRFMFQAYGNSGANGTFSRTATFSNITLNITYTLPYTKPCVTAVSLSKTTGHPGEQVTLAWRAQSGVNNAVTAYKVYRADALDGTYALLQTMTSTALSGGLSVSAPTPNGTYYYKIQPIGTVSGYDGDMTQAVALTVVCTVTTPPATLTLSPAQTHPNSASTLSWTGSGAGTNNPITGYRVYRALSADGNYALLWSGTGASVTVYARNEDGGQYFYKVSAVGQYLTGGLSSTYATLTTSCAQTSTFSLASNSVEAGASVALTLGGNALGKAHAVTVTFGTQTLSHQLAAGVLSQTLTIPLSWLSQIPSAVSGTAQISVSTLDGGYVLGTLTVTAGDDVVPQISGGTAVPSSSVVPAAWNVYVAGYSLAVLSLPVGASASGAYGSRITGYRIECAGATKRGASLPLTLTTGTLLSGAYQARFIAIDSRGREGAQTLTINVQAYAMPYSNDLSAIRCDSTGAAADEGTYIKLTGTIIYASCAGYNAVTASVRYQKSGDAVWTDAGNMTSGSPMIIAGGGAAITDNYDVLVTMTDSLGNAPTRELTVPKSAFALHFTHSGGISGIAFGKAAEIAGAVDIGAWDLYADGVKGSPFGQSRNLLDNWDFRAGCVVNQRGLSSYQLTGGGGYTIDRWRGTGAIAITLGAGGVTAAIAGGQWQTFNQGIPRGKLLAGQMVTLSADVSAVSGAWYLTDQNGLAKTHMNVRIQAPGIISWTFEVNQAGSITSDTPSIALITIGNVAGSITVRRMKLELGTRSTLHLDPPMDYGAELLKCREYYIGGMTITALQASIARNYMMLNYMFGLPMRANPTVLSPTAYNNTTEAAVTVSSADADIYGFRRVVFPASVAAGANISVTFEGISAEV